MKLFILSVLILSVLISVVENKKWKEFYDCQQECRTNKECDGKCAKDFNQKCNIFKEGLIGDEDSCKYIKEFWDDAQNKDVSDDTKIPEKYGENWIDCYGKCINSLEDGYSVAYAECYQGCSANIMKFITVMSVLVIALVYM